MDNKPIDEAVWSMTDEEYAIWLESSPYTAVCGQSTPQLVGTTHGQHLGQVSNTKPSNTKPSMDYRWATHGTSHEYKLGVSNQILGDNTDVCVIASSNNTPSDLETTI